MKQRNLIKKIVINGVNMKGDLQFNLDYSVIQDIDETYGIEIQKVSSNSCSEKAVAMVSQKKEDVLNLIKKLAKHKVTPISLGDIVEDLTN